MIRRRRPSLRAADAIPVVWPVRAAAPAVSGEPDAGGGGGGDPEQWHPSLTRSSNVAHEQVRFAARRAAAGPPPRQASEYSTNRVTGAGDSGHSAGPAPSQRRSSSVGRDLRRAELVSLSDSD